MSEIDNGFQKLFGSFVPQTQADSPAPTLAESFHARTEQVKQEAQQKASEVRQKAIDIATKSTPINNSPLNVGNPEDIYNNSFRPTDAEGNYVNPAEPSTAMLGSRLNEHEMAQVMDKYNFQDESEILPTLFENKEFAAIRTLYGDNTASMQEQQDMGFDENLIKLNDAKLTNSQGRTGSEVASDTALAIGQWANTTARSALLISDRMNPFGDIRRDPAYRTLLEATADKTMPDASDEEKAKFIKDNLPDMTPYLFQPGGKVDTSLKNLGKDIQDAKSDSLKASYTILEDEFKQKEAENKAKFDAYRAEGNDGVAVDVAESIMGGLQYIGLAVQRPDVLADIVTTTAPDIVIGGAGVARMSMKAGISNLANKELVKLNRGLKPSDAGYRTTLSKEELATVLARPESINYIQKVGVQGAVIYAGLAEGGSAGTASFDRVMDMSHDYLKENSEAYNTYLKTNSPEEARYMVALEVAKQSMDTQAVMAMGATVLTGAGMVEAQMLAPNKLFNKLTNSEASLFNKASTVGKESLNRTVNMTRSGLENASQGATNMLAQNKAIQDKADATQKLSEGVSRSMGEGFLGGMGVTGAVYSGHFAKHGVGATIQGTGKVVSTVAKPIVSKAMERFTGKAKETQEATRNEQKASIDAVMEGVVNPTPAQDTASNTGSERSATDFTQRTQDVVDANQGKSTTSTKVPNVKQPQVVNSYEVQTPKGYNRVEVSSETASQGKPTHVVDRSTIPNPEYFVQTPEARQVLLENTNAELTNRGEDVGQVLSNIEDMLMNIKNYDEPTVNEVMQYALAVTSNIRSQAEGYKNRLGTLEPNTQQYADTTAMIMGIEQGIMATPLYQNVATAAISFAEMNPTTVQEAISKIQTAKDLSKVENEHLRPVLWQIGNDVSQVPTEVIDNLVTNADALGLTPAQKTLVQTAQEAKSLEHVRADVVTGSKEFKGLKAYYNDAMNAIANGDDVGLRNTMGQMQYFRDYMQMKADTFQKTLENVQKTGISETPTHPYTGTPWLTSKGTPVIISRNSANKFVPSVLRDADTVSRAFDKLSDITMNQNKVVKPTDINSHDTVEETVQPTVEPTQEVKQDVAQETVESKDTTEQTVEPVQETPETPVVNKPVAELLLNNTVESIPVSKATSAKSEITQKDAGDNLLKRYYTAGKGKTQFHTVENVIGKVLEAKTVEELSEVLGKNITDAEQGNNIQDALGFVRKMFVPELLKALPDITDPQKLYWNKFGLNYFAEPTTNERGETVYKISETTAEAIGLGALNWISATGGRLVKGNTPQEVRQMFNIDSKANLPTELFNRFTHGIPKVGLSEQLGRQIMNILGLKLSNRDEIPMSVEFNIVDSLGSAAINTLERMGYIKTESISSEEIAGLVNTPVATRQELKKVQFITANTGSVKGEATNATDRLLDLGKNVASHLLGSIIPDTTRKVALINKAFNNVRVDENGSQIYRDDIKNAMSQKAPELLAKARAVEANKIYKLDTPFIDMAFNKFGEDSLREVLGYTPEQDMLHMSQDNKATAKGKNQTIDSAINLMQGFLARIDAEGIPLDEAEIRTDYNIAGNYRLNMNSEDFNPQLHKLHREMSGREHVELSLNNNVQMESLKAAIAQGMGIDVDKQSYKKTMAEYDAFTKDPVYRTAIDTIKKTIKTDDELTPDEIAGIKEAIKNGGEEARSFRALTVQAQFELAQESGAKTFKTNYAIELDGVTHGPFTALLQLGLNEVSPELFQYMKRGGLFFGEINRLYNDMVENDKSFRDLYQKSADAAQQHFTMNLNHYIQREGKNSPVVVRSRILSQMIGISKIKVGFEDGSDVATAEITRKGAKNPVTVSGAYGGSDRANVVNLAKDAIATFSEKLTNYLQQRSKASPQEVAKLDLQLQSLVKTMNAITNPTLDIMTKKGVMKKTFGAPVNIKNFTDASNFIASKEHMDGLVASINEVIGESLAFGISENLGTVQNRASYLVNASNIMNAIYVNKFDELLYQKTEELRAKGELSEYHSLNRAQYNEVYQEALKYAPVIGSAMINGEALNQSLNQGILASRRDKTETTFRSASPVKTNDTAKTDVGSQSTFSYTTPGSAGVRILAMAIQAQEGATQAYSTVVNKISKTTDNFDAIGSSLDNVNATGAAINVGYNKAVTDVNLMQDFYNRFKAFVDNLGVEELATQLSYIENTTDKAFLKDDIKHIKRTLGLEETDTILPQNIELFIRNFHKETVVQTSIKEALFDKNIPRTVDQFTASNHPTNFNISGDMGGKTVEQYVRELAQQKIADMPKLVDDYSPIAPSLVAQNYAVKDATQPLPDTGEINTAGSVDGKHNTTTMSRDMVVNALKKRFAQNKDGVGNYVLDKIINGIPSDITVHFGSKESISKLARENHPETFANTEFKGDGAYIDNTIYVTTKGTETILHELVHSATANLIFETYQGGKVTPRTKTVVRQLTELGKKFMNTEFKHAETQHMQKILRELYHPEQMGEFTSEFVAWVLTNPNVRLEAVTTSAKGGVSQFLQKAKTFLSKLFGIEGISANNYFGRVLEKANILADTYAESTEHVQVPLFHQASQDVNSLGTQSLFNNLSGNNSPRHTKKLLDMAHQLKDNLGTFLSEKLGASKGFEDTLLFGALKHPDVTKQVDTLKAHGFKMNQQEAYIYSALEMAVNEGLKLHQFERIDLQRLYDTAKGQLTPEMLSMGESLDLGKSRYEALFGLSALQEKDGVTNRLSNFIALAYTNEKFGNLLHQIDTRSPKQNGIKDISTLVGNGLSNMFGILSRSGMGKDMQARLETLADRLTILDAKGKESIYKKIYNDAQDTVDALTSMTTPVRDTVAKSVDNWLASNSAVARVLGMVPNAMISEVNLNDYVGGLTTLLNNTTGDKHLGAMQNLAFEMLGTNDMNRSIHNYVNVTKAYQDQVRQKIVENVPKYLKSKFNSDLTPEQSTVIQQTVTDLDMAGMYSRGYNLNQLKTLVTDGTARTAEINAKEMAIQHLVGNNTPLLNFINNLSNGLGYMLATGKAGYAFQLNNVHAILQVGTSITNSKLSDATINKLVPLMDDLATLQGLNYTSKESLDVLGKLFDTDANGLSATMKLTQVLRDAETAKSPSIAKYLVPKGFSNTLNNPNSKIVIAPNSDTASLEAQGFVKGNLVQTDIADSNKEPMYFFYSDVSGQSRWMSGAMSTLRQTIGGIDVRSGQTKGGIKLPSYFDTDKVQTITQRKHSALNQLTQSRVPVDTQGTHLVPILDGSGKVQGYSYLLSKADRDARLETNNDFADVIASWQGRVVEEQLAPQLNKGLVDILRDQFKKDVNYGYVGQHVVIDGNSKDARLNEIYKMMPPEMKQYIKQTFPNGKLMVRKDLLDNAMGFRQYSITEVFKKNPQERTNFEKSFMAMASFMFGKNTARYLAKGEKGWQELVSLGKDIVVVKNVIVQASNMISNMVQNFYSGIGFLQQMKDYTVAVESAESFNRNSVRKINLQNDLLLAETESERKRIMAELKDIQDKMARSPVADLINAGLLPTISNDVDYQASNSSVGHLFDKVDRTLDKLPVLGSAVKNLTLMKTSSAYKFLNRANQYSDFISKYSLYRHLTTRKVNPMTKEQALNRVTDEFVNYNLLPSKERNYIESMGGSWFLNYKIRAQKIMLRQLRDNPARVLSFMALGPDAPTMYDANLITGSLSYNLGPENIARMYGSHPLIALMSGMGSMVTGQVFR